MVKHSINFDERGVPQAANRGWVLVAVLSFLGLVMVLVTTLSLLTRVDSTVGLAQTRQAEARRHAWLALELARAHLQESAGPDRRVTATSGWGNAVTPGSQGLTGVWATDSGESRLVTWLVSGNHGSDRLAVTPATLPSPETAAGPDEVFLVGRATVSRDRDRIKGVRQPLQVPESLLPGGQGVEPGSMRRVGHFAYWVGDEGVKASLRLASGAALPDYDPGPPGGGAPGFAPGEAWASDPVARQCLLQAASRGPHVDFLFPGLDTGVPGVPGRLSRVLTREQLAFVDPAMTPARLRAAFAALTTESRAVLVDTLSGGVRRDLSDLPEVPDAALRRFLVERPTGAVGAVSLHRLQPATVGGREAGDDSTLVFSVGPVVTEYLVRFRVVRDPTTGRVGVAYEHQVELWNPYAAHIEAEPGELSLRALNLPRLWLESATGATEVDLSRAVGPAQTRARESWHPGEIRVLRGATWLGAERAEGVVYPETPLVLADGLEAGDLMVRAERVPSERSIGVETRVRGEFLAVVQDSVAFQEQDRAAAWEGSGSPWLLGYGLQLREEPGAWCCGDRDDARDPRWPWLDSASIEHRSPRWGPLPGDNVGELSDTASPVFHPSRRFVLFELPRQEVVSLGALQHLITRRPYSVGNPWGGPLNGWFDRAWFSTVPRGFAIRTSEPPILPGPSVAFHWRLGIRPPDAGDRSADSGGILTGATSGVHFLQRGSFNVNAREAVAWRAFLGGVTIRDWRHGETLESTSRLNHAFIRFGHAAQGSPGSPREPGPGPFADWAGVRCLRDDQVEALAREVVLALQRRSAPFPTLRAFLTAGVLSEALETSGINAGLASSEEQRPGWLSQADVVTTIAPFLSCRSDTFLVRAYGDRLDPATGLTDARAWCEAMVQRVPELDGQSDSGARTEVEQAVADPVRYPRGRRFVVTAFRWLTEADL